MPTYQFRCRRCGSEHVVTLSFQDKDGYFPDCEECGAKMAQVFSPVGVVFRGAGFYRNDSRPAPKPEKKEKTTEKKKETSSDIS
jgi:putative FmdB family regulatory protein